MSRELEQRTDEILTSVENSLRLLMRGQAEEKDAEMIVIQLFGLLRFRKGRSPRLFATSSALQFPQQLWI